MSDEFPPSTLQKLVASLLGGDGPIAVLLKELVESNREIKRTLKLRELGAVDDREQVDPLAPRKDAFGTFSSFPPAGLKRSLIRERAKGVVLALLRGDVRSDEAADQIAELVAPTITREQITIAVCRAFDVPSTYTNAKLEAAIDNVMEVINGRR